MRSPESPPPGRPAGEQPAESTSAHETLRENAARENAGRDTVSENLEGRERVSERGSFLADHRAEQPERERAPISGVQKRVLAFTWIGVLVMLIYGVFMILSAFNPGYRPIDFIARFMLLFGVLFILFQGFGYANQMLKASVGYDELKRRAFTPSRTPKVACLIAAYNEPADVLEETVAAVVGMDYPAKQVVLLDDSTKDENRQAAREIGARYGIEVVQRNNRRGFKAGAINDFLPKTDAEYIAVFDADAMPAHNFLRDIVPIVEENPRLGFVQTPQYYANEGISTVAQAATNQQVVFYQYICEGKSHSHAMFCCGTNVVMRRQALLDVKGFDENTVSEDMATGLDMHLKGYDSTYYNRVYAYSLAPENLSAYFTQQSRWALGTVGLGRNLLRAFFGGPTRLRAGQWWEYFLSTTYYWVGWVNFFFMCLPLLYIFFNIKPLRQDVFTYIAIFIPYMLFTMNMFYSGMEARGYKMSDIILGQQLGFIAFPTHMVSALSGLFGLKRPFATTPKGQGGAVSWISLWPQLLMLVLSAIAFVWGVYKYAVGLDRNTSAILVNAVWALYHVFLLSGIFVLNKVPLRRGEQQRHFADSDARPARSRVIPQGELAAAGAAGTGAGTGVTGVGPGLFAPVSATGESVSTTDRTTPRVLAPPRRAGANGWALGLMVASLVFIGLIAWSFIGWWLAPKQPVNVYVLDRTTGRDYQEHRGLTWTLNYLKLSKQDGFGPEGASSGTGYDFAKDFWGYIPGNPDNAQEDPTHQADLIVGGQDRPLPEEFKAPGVIYLADTYGEFVEYDYGKEKYIRYGLPLDQRGIKPEEVDRIIDFHDRGGLVLGEWNTIGYPTLPAETVTDRAALQQGLTRVKVGLKFYQTQELPRRMAALKQAQADNNASAIAIFENQIAETKERIRKAQRDQTDLESLIESAAQRENQLAAQKRLEKLLKADYRGWYGRYVDNFADEREYDFRMWKNVRDSLSKRFPNDKSKWEPRGPGFVFYKDGPSRIFNEETKQLEENPFSVPVVITQEELGEGPTNNYAEIVRNSKAADDPLLEGVPESMACRFWFDVVAPLPGAKVLAWYKLQIKDEAATRLKSAGFPASMLKSREGGRTEVVMPAAIASREGSDLSSLYFCGDASDYQLVSRFAQMLPASGGVLGFLGKHTGSFSTQFYWNFYEPMVQNALTGNKKIQHS
jgi:cellulose synthase (UDP-forming)